MKTQLQRIKIAEACGYEHVPAPYSSDTIFVREPTPGCKRVIECPDYLDDLNSMHEAESYQLEKDGWKFQCGYLINLREVGLRRRKDSNAVQVDFWIMYATAAQRAEAFLRTLNLWRES